MATTREFGSLHEWLEYDHMVRYCSNNEEAVRDKLGLPKVYCGYDTLEAGEQVILDYAQKYGEPYENAHREIARKLNVAPTYKNRMLLSEKRGYERVEVFKAPSDQPQIAGIPAGSQCSSCPYVTPDGQNLMGYVFKIKQNEDDTIKLPVTMWRDQYQREIFEPLGFSTEKTWPLFNLNKIVASSKKQAVICVDEEQAFFLSNEFSFWRSISFLLRGWLVHRIHLTTRTGNGSRNFSALL